MSEYKYKVLLCLAQNTYSMLVCVCVWIGCCCCYWCISGFLSLGCWCAWFFVVPRTAVELWWLVKWLDDAATVYVWVCDSLSLTRLLGVCLDGDGGEKRDGGAKKKKNLYLQMKSGAEHGDTAASRVMVTMLASASPTSLSVRSCGGERWTAPGWGQEYIVSRFLRRLSDLNNHALSLGILLTWAAEPNQLLASVAPVCEWQGSRNLSIYVARNQSFAIDSGIDSMWISSSFEFAKAVRWSQNLVLSIKYTQWDGNISEIVVWHVWSRFYVYATRTLSRLSCQRPWDYKVPKLWFASRTVGKLKKDDRKYD